MPSVMLSEKGVGREERKAALETEKQVEKSTLPEIPNGGFMAWLQVAAAFCIFFNTWGVVNMYGVYQTFYKSDFLSSQSESNISWIGSIQSFLLLVVGALAGTFYDAGYLRALLCIGVFLSVFGMMMTSICTTYWQVILAHGVVVGFGFGCLFVASLAVVSQYFTTKKAFATGIASTGSSIGGVIYPIIFSQLQPRIGFGWATRVIAFIMLGTSAVALLGMRQRFPASTRREIFDLKALRDLPFFVYCLGLFFGFMGIYIAFFYIEIYALTVSHTDTNLTFYLLPIINATSTLGRLLPNFFADKIGPLNIQIPFALIAALLCFCWISVTTTPGLIVLCVLYGFFCGSFVSLPGPTVVTLSPNLGVIGTRIGMSGAFAGTGLLIGSPIAGAILGGPGGWTGLKVWCGLLLAVSGLCSLGARALKTGIVFRVKA